MSLDPRSVEVDALFRRARRMFVRPEAMGEGDERLTRKLRSVINDRTVDADRRAMATQLYRKLRETGRFEGVVRQAVGGRRGIYKWTLADCWTCLYKHSTGTFTPNALGPITCIKPADGNAAGPSDSDILFIQVPPSQTRQNTMSTTFWAEVGFAGYSTPSFAGDPGGGGSVVLPSSTVRIMQVLHSNLSNPVYVNDVRAYSFLPDLGPWQLAVGSGGWSVTHGTPQAGQLQLSQIKNGVPFGNRASVALDPSDGAGGMLALGFSLACGWAGGVDPDDPLECSIAEIESVNVYTTLGAGEIA